jgi:plastocyanin
MRKALVLSAALTAVAAFAVPTLAATKSIKVGDNYYVRDGGAPTVTVKRNDTVRWKFVGRNAHTVTVKSGPAKFTSRAMRSGTFSRRLTKSGSYRIFCRIHGAGDHSMRLRVKK